MFFVRSGRVQKWLILTAAEVAVWTTWPS